MADSPRTLDRLVHPHQAIGDGILGVQAKMDETRVGHGGATKNQGAILTPRGGSQKTKRQPKLPFVRIKRNAQLARRLNSLVRVSISIMSPMSTNAATAVHTRWA